MSSPASPERPVPSSHHRPREEETEPQRDDMTHPSSQQWARGSGVPENPRAHALHRPDQDAQTQAASEPPGRLGVSDSVGLGWSPKTCMSRKFPGDAPAPGTHTENHHAAMLMSDHISSLAAVLA